MRIDASHHINAESFTRECALSLLILLMLMPRILLMLNPPPLENADAFNLINAMMTPLILMLSLCNANASTN